MADLADSVGVSNHKRSRNRAILSCTRCRTAKLKCDRKTPCSQCERRGRAAGDCVYRPMPQTARKPQRAAKKLKDIQGAVREMIRADNGHPEGRLVVGRQGEGTYVGATHFMTILDDVSGPFGTRSPMTLS